MRRIYDYKPDSSYAPGTSEYVYKRIRHYSRMFGLAYEWLVGFEKGRAVTIFTMDLRRPTVPEFTKLYATTKSSRTRSDATKKVIPEITPQIDAQGTITYRTALISADQWIERT